jgi:hypothetical protein
LEKATVTFLSTFGAILAIYKIFEFKMDLPDTNIKDLLLNRFEIKKSDSGPYKAVSKTSNNSEIIPNICTKEVTTQLLFRR